MTYYKVTRPDGTSFHTDEVVYEVGKRVRPLPHDGKRRLCGPGVLHASPTAPEAAGYGRWPYRLFAVEGQPFVEDSDKAGFKQLRVVAELDVAECFGPNGQRVLRLIRRAERLTTEEANHLQAAWDTAGSAARYAAWYAAWDAARDAAWDAAWDAARDTARDTAGSAARYAAWYAAWDAARDTAWDAAGSAARYAAWALVVEGLVGTHGFTQEHYDLLTQPWREAIGEPFVEEVR